MPAVVRVVEEIKNAVGSCDWASPPVVDLRLGITADDSLVVVIRELVQCALLNSERGSERALAGTASQDLAQTLGMGALDTARWPGAKVAQATCEVQHIPRVLDWAVARHGGGKRLPVEQRAELVAAVQKTACNLALSALTRSTGSIGVDIAMVVEEVRHLRADLESANARAEDATTQLQSAKEDLLRTHTELAAVQAEADRVSHALTGVKLDLEREGRTCKTLEADVKDLRVQLRAAQEAQRVPEEVSRFLATTAEVQLQQPEITGLAVPVAFTLHVPVQRDGECEYEHYGGVLQEEATKETSMLALEMLLKEVFFRDASENLARALGIAGGVFDTARWPDAVIAQAT